MVEGTGPEGRLQPRDILDRLLSGIEALGTVYHKHTVGKHLSTGQVARKMPDEVEKAFLILAKQKTLFSSMGWVLPT